MTWSAQFLLMSKTDSQTTLSRGILLCNPFRELLKSGQLWVSETRRQSSSLCCYGTCCLRGQLPSDNYAHFPLFSSYRQFSLPDGENHKKPFKVILEIPYIRYCIQSVFFSQRGGEPRKRAEGKVRLAGHLGMGSSRARNGTVTGLKNYKSHKSGKTSPPLRPRGGAWSTKMASRLSGNGGGEQRLVSLPLSRIRVIMKSSPEVSSINPDAIFLTAKATELFVQYLATHSYKHGQGKENRALTYSDLSRTAEKSDTFQFLADILPKKILASKYLKMLEKEKEGEEEGEEAAAALEEEEEEEESEDDAS